MSSSSALDGIKEEVEIFNIDMGKAQSWTKVLGQICICCTFLNTQDLARNMRPVSKRGKKYNRCTCEKHVTLVGAGSRKGLYYYYTMRNPPPDPHTVLEPMNQLKVFPYSIL